MFTYLFLSALGRYILKRHIVLIMIPVDFVTLLIPMFRENNDSQLSDSDTCTNFSIRHNYYCNIVLGIVLSCNSFIATLHIIILMWH